MTPVLVTGIGIVSSLGCTLTEVEDALRRGRSGVKAVPELTAAGLRSSAYAPVQNLPEDCIDGRSRRTMSQGAYYATVAAKAALTDAGLTDRLDGSRTSAIIGGEMGGINDLVTMRRMLHAGKKSRCGAAGVTKVMDSTASGNMASVLGLRGRAYGVLAGMSTGLAAIRQGAELISHGLADVAICGSADEDCWQQLGHALERSGELAATSVESPECACRPFDAARNGTVLSAGAGVVVLESEEHARRRDAQPRAEIVGWGCGSDGGNSLALTGAGLQRALKSACTQADGHGTSRLDLIHAGANGTRRGDAVEAGVLREAFGETVPVSATTGLTGFATGASSAIRAVLTLLMLRYGFVAPTTNLDTVAPECAGLRHVRETLEIPLSAALCTAASFGCFNECLIVRRVNR